MDQTRLEKLKAAIAERENTNPRSNSSLHSSYILFLELLMYSSKDAPGENGYMKNADVLYQWLSPITAPPRKAIGIASAEHHWLQTNNITRYLSNLLSTDYDTVADAIDKIHARRKDT